MEMGVGDISMSVGCFGENKIGDLGNLQKAHLCRHLVSFNAIWKKQRWKSTRKKKKDYK